MTLIKAGTGAQKSINPMVFIAVIGMICVITSGAFAKKGAAVNTRWYTQNPTAEVFRISTAAELAGLAQIVNGTWGGAPERDDFSGKTIRLAKNINLSDYNDWVPIGSITYDRWNNTGSRGVMWDPSNEKPFAGTFDGGGHVIRNTLGRRQSSADNKNLFGYILGGRVVNLRLDGMNIRDGDIVGHSYLYISNKAESVLPDRHSSARSSRDGGTSPILLTAVIADSVITIGAMGGFMPSIFYREFHRYITRDGLDTLVEYTPGRTPFNPQTGRELTIHERLETRLYLTDERYNIKAGPEGMPLLVCDELKKRLTMIKERYNDAPDADDIIIAAENQVVFDKILSFMDVARSAGYPNISFAKLRNGGDDRSGELKSVESGGDSSVGHARMAASDGRSPASIQRVVMQNMSPLRRAYNERLREIPDLEGRITVKFSINESGDVISAQATESTINDPELENFVIERVKGWNFGPIDKPGDVTEVTYPFVFSQ